MYNLFYHTSYSVMVECEHSLLNIKTTTVSRLLFN